MRTVRVQLKIIGLVLYLGVQAAGAQDLPYRAIVGLQQSGASSAKGVQRFFMDMRFDHPINTKGPVNLKVWGDARISTVPQQIDSTVREFATSFLDKVTD